MSRSAKLSADVVRCPQCGTPQNRRLPDSIYRCDRCGGMFDGDPEEGSPDVYDDPVKSLEAKERREQGRGRRRY